MADSSAVQEAVRAVLQLVQEADGREMVGKRKPKEASAIAAPPECEACKAGECSDPDHASEEDLSSLLEE